jgi:hypothetical protein
MSIWDEITSKAESFSLSDLQSGAGSLLKVYNQSEKTRNSSHVNARAAQAAARYVPELESQGNGAPVSVEFKQPERDLVGEVPKDSAVIDKNLVYFGGGLIALLLVGGFIIAIKK